MHSQEGIVIKKQIHHHFFKFGRGNVIQTTLQHNKVSKSKVWIKPESSKLEIFVLSPGPDVDGKELPWPLK